MTRDQESPEAEAQRKANFDLFMRGVADMPLLRSDAGALYDRMMALLDHFSGVLSAEDAKKLVELVQLAVLREGDRYEGNDED